VTETNDMGKDRLLLDIQPLNFIHTADLANEVEGRTPESAILFTAVSEWPSSLKRDCIC